MSKYFITFGSGEWRRAGKRLISEARSTELFDDVVAYTEEDLKSDKNFPKAKQAVPGGKMKHL